MALLFIVRRLTQPLSSLVAAARAEHAEADFAAAAADVQEIAAAIEALNSAVRERDERLQAQTRVLEAQAREAEEELRAAGKATTEFIGVMSHELRTPITTIYGGARLLQNRRKSLEEGAAEELIASIEEEAERLFRLVKNLLALARSDLGEEIVPDVLPVGPLVEQAVRQFSSRRPGRPLEVNAAPGLPLVLAEPGYVHQVLQNLITNADKYSDAGRPIEVAIEADANEVTIRVLDRGAGVAEAELDQIFDSFLSLPEHRPGRRAAKDSVSRSASASSRRCPVASGPAGATGAASRWDLPCPRPPRLRPIWSRRRPRFNEGSRPNRPAGGGAQVGKEASRDGSTGRVPAPVLPPRNSRPRPACSRCPAAF